MSNLRIPLYRLDQFDYFLIRKRRNEIDSRFLESFLNDFRVLLCVHNLSLPDGKDPRDSARLSRALLRAPFSVSSPDTRSIGRVHGPKRIVVAALVDVVEGLIDGGQRKIARCYVARIDDAALHEF